MDITGAPPADAAVSATVADEAEKQKPARRPRRAASGGDAVTAPSSAAIAVQAAQPAEAAAGPRVLGEAFKRLDLSPEIESAVLDLGFETPTEIQERVIPLLLEGADVIGQAQTGTGKTAAFGIPLVEGIDEEKRYPQALVLAPTRELAMQIAEQLRALTRYIPRIIVVTLYGGAGYGRQLDDLQEGAQVVVGTPGRVIDHIQRGTLKLDRIDYLVLDEADRMLDMGFLPDVERILRRTPRSRQTALFSATVSTVIRIISRRYMRNAKLVQVKAQHATVEEADQVYYEVADRDKVDGLLSLIQRDPPERAMLFRRTKIGVDKLVSSMRRHGLAAESIHGDMSQQIRERVMNQFREGKITYLVATDVAARGLDIPEVSHVFNFDIPEDMDSYVHRIGRTARAGRTGTAVTFVGEWDSDKLPALQKVAGQRLQRQVLPLYER